MTKREQIKQQIKELQTQLDTLPPDELFVVTFSEEHQPFHCFIDSVRANHIAAQYPTISKGVHRYILA